MKKSKVITTTILTTLMLAGCGTNADKDENKKNSGMSKKNVTIKDIIDDKKPHLISQNTQTSSDGEDENYQSHIFLTKNGKIKGIELSGEETTAEFINKLKPENAEKVLDNKDLIERETKWKEPMYVAVDNDEKTPEVTYVVPKSKDVKKDDVNSFEDYMSYGTEDEEVMGIAYTSLTSAQSQDPSKAKTYHGTFTYDGTETNEPDLYLSYGVQLGKKQNLKNLSVSDIKKMKDGYVYNFEDFD
ncbi:hypothetical protein [Staphylococcus sp. HMSC067F07]|uniref:hypothetical protein n=1 Tax=Staphylococcus TaxID=1279 RepID=UPI0008AA21F2|nr:hypothetical protein [Staphylococcus sp. HMSC067F07]OHQ30040.1 hypothetical protein HMPREF2706_11295 [Staphylococcus sp. HMSC067F07]